MQRNFKPSTDQRTSRNGHEPDDPTAEARDALAHGWQPIPVPIKSKNPSLPGWSTLTITEETFEQYFNEQLQNVAILNGAPSNGLVDVDLDVPLAMQLAESFLPPTSRIFGRASKPRSHWEYIGDPLPQTTTFRDSTKTGDKPERMIAEVRSTGTATIWPGSTHPSGESILWHERGEPAQVHGDALLRSVAKLAAAVLLVQHYPGQGGRDELKLPLIGALLRLDWSDGEISDFILAVATAAGDEEAQDRVNGIERSRQRLLNGEPVAGWPKLGELLNNKPLVRLIRTWLDPVRPNQPREQRQSVGDFLAYLPEHKYIFIPTRSIWVGKSVKETVAPVAIGIKDDGETIWQAAHLWLDTHQAVHQMTWAPGLPQLIEGQILDQGGWVTRSDLRAFNLYRPPIIEMGDPDQATRWVAHVRRLYPENADHVIAWFAQRVQRPGEKINHAIVLGGAPGIGKDTMLAPVKQAVGPWNVAHVSPTQVTGRFNAFIKSVILQIDEAKDLGDVNRYTFHEQMKAYTAAPPDTLPCDEKFVEAYQVSNVCGVIYTTNHQMNALYLPASDRRHYVTWSDLKAEEFPAGYFDEMYRWFAQDGGNEHVAAYLADYDLSAFNPKAPPPKTRAFWTLVNAEQTSEDAELADVLEAMGWPEAVTIKQIIRQSEKPITALGRAFGGEMTNLGTWLKERRNARQIPHRMEFAGYIRVDNPGSKDGIWIVDGARAPIYAKSDLIHGDQLTAASALIESFRNDPKS